MVEAQGTFRNQTRFRWRIVIIKLKAQAVGPPIVSLPRLLIHIFVATLHIGGRSSIRNLRMPMPGDPLTKEWNLTIFVYFCPQGCV